MHMALPDYQTSPPEANHNPNRTRILTKSNSNPYPNSKTYLESFEIGAIEPMTSLRSFEKLYNATSLYST